RIKLCTVVSGRWRTDAMRRDWSAAYAGEISGSMPEPDGTTASTGMPWIVSPGLYGRSSFRIAVTFCATSFARAGLVGPRFEKVVPSALYGGEVADGRSWKYCGFAKLCAARDDPTTWPRTVTRLPSAWCGKATCAKPVNSAGIASPRIAVKT